MARLARPRLRLDLVFEHFEELDFLWEQRERVVLAPDWTLAELAEHEARADAHLDGLVLSELHGVELAREHLTGDSATAACAAAMVLLAHEDAELAREVVLALEDDPEDARDGLRLALRHMPIEGILAELTRLAAEAPPPVASAAVDALSFHRVAAPSLARLARLATDDDPLVRALALVAAGRVGAPELDLVRALEDAAPEVRARAWEAAARTASVGHAELLARARTAAARGTDPDPLALELLGILGDADDLPLLVDALQRPDVAPAAVRALGALGLPGGVPSLLERLDDPDLGPLAGAAFVRITGEDDLASAAGLPDEESDPDAPVPLDAERARECWEERADRFDPTHAWQHGRPLTPGSFDDPELPLALRRDLYLGARSRAGASIPDVEYEARAALRNPPGSPAGKICP